MGTEEGPNESDRTGTDSKDGSRRRGRGAAGAALAGTGAATTASAAAACCVPVISPFLVSVLGASGAVWITGLKPWAPHLLVVSFALLAYGSWSYRRARTCRDHGGGAKHGRGLLDRSTPVLLGVAAVAWVASLVAYLLFT